METANLDGETDLKIRTALPDTASWMRSASDAADFSCTIECEAPNLDLFAFDGRITLVDASGLEKTVRIALDSMLLRGTLLRSALQCRAWNQAARVQIDGVGDRARREHRARHEDRAERDAIALQTQPSRKGRQQRAW